jgi:hypothetical protein
MSIAKRFQLFAFIPYRTNSEHTGDTINRYSGVGDVSAIISYNILKNKGEKRWQQLLFAALGIKAPTGSRKTTGLEKKGDLLNMQTGTGSWDAILNTSYAIMNKTAGINTEASYTITSPDRNGYKYGNKLSGTMQAFYLVNAFEVTLMPFAGLQADHALHDYDNYSRRWLNEQTGGTIAYAFTGIQMNYRRIALQTGYYTPIAGRYADGYVSAKHRIDISLLFLFK